MSAEELMYLAEGSAPTAVPAAPGKTPLRRRHAWQWLAWGLGVLGIAALLAADLHNEKVRTDREARERLQQQARLLDQALSRQMAALDAALSGVVHDLPGWQPEAQFAHINRRLVALSAAVAGARTLLLADAQGTVYAANRANLVGLSVADRAYFREARSSNQAERLYVSTPFRSFLGIWSLNLTRVVQDAEGRFAGVVTSTLDPEWVAVTLGSANFAPDMWAALVHDTGPLLLMTPAPVPGLDGMDLNRPGTMYRRHLDSGQVETVLSGRIHATGQTDRVIVQRSVRPPGVNAPVGVTLALSRDLGAVQAGWMGSARDAAVFMAVLVLLSGGGLAWVQRADRRAALADGEARQALVSQAKRWLLALDSSGLGVWDADLRSGQEHHSPRWRALLGVGPDDTAARSACWRERLHPDDAAETLRRFQAHLDGQTPAYEAEARLRVGDGSYRWMLLRGRAVERDAEGHALRVVGTLVDVHDSREAETLRAERDGAAAASRAKTEFVSRMSHELRTPLNAVLGFAQLLAAREGQLTPAQQRDYVARIEEGGWHLLELVNDVLDLSLVESGEIVLDLQPVDLPALVLRAVEAVAALAQRHGVPVHLVALPEAALVRADALRLREVLTNLLGNALKYNRPGGQVRVEVAAAPGAWRISVADTGLGIAAEQLPHLFEPFNRLGHENSAIEGSGLGLVLARWYVDKMGGHIEVQSTLGEGSRFTVQLPAA